MIQKNVFDRLTRIQAIGTMIELACNNETQLVDIPTLAECGKAVAEEADLALEMLDQSAEGNQKKRIGLT